LLLELKQGVPKKHQTNLLHKEERLDLNNIFIHFNCIHGKIVKKVILGTSKNTQKNPKDERNGR
jgi:hypothetical protein